MKKHKEAKAIVIGSVVQLKSGGPHMTVVSAITNVGCVLTVLWADTADRIAKADIAIQAFKLIR